MWLAEWWLDRQWSEVVTSSSLTVPTFAGSGVSNCMTLCMLRLSKSIATVTTSCCQSMTADAVLGS